MKTSLTLLIAKLELNPVAVLNGLQDAGLVSDNCVSAEDVAPADCFAACVWVLEQRERLK